MIAMPVQTCQTLRPVAAEPAVPAGFEGACFAMQLAEVEVAAAPPESVMATGPVTDLPLTGNILPPVDVSDAPSATAMTGKEALALTPAHAPRPDAADRVARTTGDETSHRVASVVETPTDDVPYDEPEVLAPLATVLPLPGVPVNAAAPPAPPRESRPGPAVQGHVSDPTVTVEALSNAFPPSPAPATVPVAPHASVRSATLLRARAPEEAPADRLQAVPLPVQAAPHTHAPSPPAMATMAAAYVERPAVPGRSERGRPMPSVDGVTARPPRAAPLAIETAILLDPGASPLPFASPLPVGHSQTVPVAAGTSAPPSALDFSALVDRIVAARSEHDAPVSVAVRHAEFGAVTLRFEQRDSGLTAVATSPDPEFARAAAAALPPERSESAQLSGRENGHAARPHEGHAQGHMSGQSRQMVAPPPRPTPNATPASTTDDGPMRGTGIFA